MTLLYKIAETPAEFEQIHSTQLPYIRGGNSTA